MRVRVLRTSTTPADEKALLKLLSEAGLPIEDAKEKVSEEEESFLDDLAADQEPVPDEDDHSLLEEDEKELYAAEDIYVLVVTPECVDDDETDLVIRRAATTGQVVGIWPAGITQGRVPAALDRLGGSLVPWDVELLRDAIVRGVTTWREPSGDYRVEPKTKRNKC
ncbi:MAG TPA: hypothetical protein VN155_13280 [Devosia sp.]|nr:hypothetical protein [Devosia sp.]